MVGAATTQTRTPDPGALAVLVVDDEAPARGELAWLLDADPRIRLVRAVDDGAEALRALDAEPFDAVFCDIRMPGLDGLDLARVLGRFAEPPQVVFVTAHEGHAVDAFDLRATDYLLKPVRPDRLAEAVRRVDAAIRSAHRAPVGPSSRGAGAGDGPGAAVVGRATEAEAETETAAVADETFPVELGGVTRFVHRSQVRYAVAQGDYVRLHTATGGHLVRVSLSTLEERWAAAGFVRIHRSTLVALACVDELRMEDGRCAVRLGDRVLPVSRRHTRALRDRLIRAASLTRGPGRDG
ncbi:response regulator transcription factor [Frankia sp. CNm7]|uniref:LytR/AlgR family response regulator transcription factor n=1 Tax=Frankia nepalensis TaxID=1836974 RepID=UPI001DAE7D5B|nr:LytTR family DNA-binding domain-containing protein [Frankia nepalensis]MBL7522893.1 response regulator transcription factor [Frankia nepalensis]